MRSTLCVIVNRDPAALFALSQDYSRRPEWDSYLSEAHLLGDASVPAIGVDSYCKNKSGSAMVSRYVSYQPPLVAAVTMIKGPWILGRFSGSWRFERVCELRTRVVFTYNLQTRPAILRPIIELVVSNIYTRQMKTRLESFKHWAEHPHNENS